MNYTFRDGSRTACHTSQGKHEGEKVHLSKERFTEPNYSHDCIGLNRKEEDVEPNLSIKAYTSTAADLETPVCLLEDPFRVRSSQHLSIFFIFILFYIFKRNITLKDLRLK